MSITAAQVNHFLEGILIPMIFTHGVSAAIATKMEPSNKLIVSSSCL